MKNQIIGAFRFLISIAFITAMVSCAGKKDSNDKSLGYKIIEQVNLSEDPGYYMVDKSYPFFAADDASLNKKLDILNMKIEGYLDTATQYYWGVSFDEVRKIKDETQGSGIYELKNSYRILDTTPDFVSLKMETYSYALGAHGFTAIHTFNFSIDDMRFLQLSDILDLSAPESENLLNQLLLKNFENPDDCFDAEPTANEDFRLFAMDKEHLIFFYEAYELGAYYCGMGKVAVAVSDLKNAGLWKWEGK